MSDSRSGRHISISSLVTKNDDISLDKIESPKPNNLKTLKSPQLLSILNPIPATPSKSKVMSLSELMNDDNPNEPTPAETTNNTPSAEVETRNKKVGSKAEPTKEVEKVPLPAIINIEIPLSTHNDIHSEHAFSRLVEEKYGADAQTTTINKSLWNYDGDDDDDDDEGDDDAILETENNSNDNNNHQTVYDDEDEIVKSLNIKFAPGLSDLEKEKIVLNEIHRRKMENNKRIGKYDVDDPFIDDQELVYEEDTNANADGWFVWYGDLEVNNKPSKRQEPVEAPKPAKQTKPGRSSNNSSNSANGNEQSKGRIPSTVASGEKRPIKDIKLSAAEPLSTKKHKTSNAVIKPKELNAAKELKPVENGTPVEKPPSLIIGSFGF